MSGSCSASWPRAARRLPCSSGPQREHDGLERRPREARRLLLARRRLADRVADPDGAEAADRRHLPGREHVAPRRTGRREHLDRGRLRLLPSADAHALARAERAGEQAHVRDALARRRALDLEHAAGDVGVRVAARRPRGARRRRRAARRSPPPRRRPEEHRVHPALPRLRGELPSRRRAVRERGLVADERPQDRLVVLGEDLREERSGAARRTAIERGGDPSARRRGASRRAMAASDAAPGRPRPGRSC